MIITKNNNLFNITDNQYFAKKIHNTSNITNNITKHINNNYENNIIKRISTTTKNINYNNEYNDLIYHNKKVLNKKNYYNFYNDTFNFKKIENISLSQQTDIINNITETNQQTINYIDNNFINNNNIATIITAPPPLIGYVWVPETSDNVVPGLDSILTYIQSKYASISTLQNEITNLSNNISTDITNIQNDISNLPTQNVSKTLSYHTNHTDFMFEKKVTNHNYDNRRKFALQQHYFTYIKKVNTESLELQIQFLQLQIDNLQTQINNLQLSGGGSGGGGEIGII